MDEPRKKPFTFDWLELFEIFAFRADRGDEFTIKIKNDMIKNRKDVT